jgi:ariadne-1
MEEMQQTSDLSWIEVQFLKKAVDVTVLSRTTLKWTYAFAFYLDRTNETELFEVGWLNYLAVFTDINHNP